MVGRGGGGDTRIVCAAVAKSEMIYLEFIRKEEMKGKNKRQKKGGSGAMNGTGLTSLHSLPSLPPPVHKAWARLGEGQQKSDKKTKAACSNRLLPMGCHGNRGARGTQRPQ